MTEARTLDELPDQVFVALGRRGMEGISLKECTYECDGQELNLIDVTVTPKEITGKGTEEVVEDWRVECNKCKRAFTIRCQIRYHDAEKIDTKVSILDDTGKNLGWLGSY